MDHCHVYGHVELLTPGRGLLTAAYKLRPLYTYLRQVLRELREVLSGRENGPTNGTFSLVINHAHSSMRFPMRLRANKACSEASEWPFSRTRAAAALSTMGPETKPGLDLTEPIRPWESLIQSTPAERRPSHCSVVLDFHVGMVSL